MRCHFALPLLAVSVAGAQIPVPTPFFTTNGVVNAASGVLGITPGGIATIFGFGLTFNLVGILRAPGFPLPANIYGTQLFVNGQLAPLLAVSSINGRDQINFQAPFELAGSTLAVLQVTNGVAISRPVPVPVIPIQPGIFTSDGKRGIVVHGLNNALVTPQNPASHGEEIVIYATGLGAVTPFLGTGVAASPMYFTYAAGTTLALFAGVSMTPDFAGLTPGFAGLFQINVAVPADAPVGDIALGLSVNGITSPTVLLAVK